MGKNIYDPQSGCYRPWNSYSQDVASGVIDASGGVFKFNGSVVSRDTVIDPTVTANWNPATDIDAGGIAPHPNGDGSYAGTVVKFIGPILAFMQSGFTLVATFSPGAAISFDFEMFGTIYTDVSAQWNPYLPSFLPQSHIAIDGAGQAAIDQIDNVINGLEDNKLVVTATQSRLIACVNGSDPLIGPWNSLEGLTSADLQLGDGGELPTCRFRNFLFLPAQDIITTQDLSRP